MFETLLGSDVDFHWIIETFKGEMPDTPKDWVNYTRPVPSISPNFSSRHPDAQFSCDEAPCQSDAFNQIKTKFLEKIQNRTQGFSTPRLNRLSGTVHRQNMPRE